MIGGFRSVLCVSLFQGSLLFHDRNDNWWQWKTHFWRQRLNFRVRVFLKHTYIHIPANALRFPLCSIILSCCVWISWWTPRTRSFFTSMVPFLRCLLSINKARAQSELSPGAAKQTSCDLAKSNFIVLLYEKWSPYSVYYLGPCVSKIMKSSKSTLLCWKKKDKSNNRMLGENFELQVWEELATLQLLILARITTVPLILRIFSHDPAITLVK